MEVSTLLREDQASGAAGCYAAARSQPRRRSAAKGDCNPADGWNWRFGILCSAERLAAKKNLAVSIDSDDLHVYLLTFLQFVANVLDTMVSDLRHVKKPVCAAG